MKNTNRVLTQMDTFTMRGQKQEGGRGGGIERFCINEAKNTTHKNTLAPLTSKTNVGQLRTSCLPTRWAANNKTALFVVVFLNPDLFGSAVATSSKGTRV
jgi:hypothetical protein